LTGLEYCLKTAKQSFVSVGMKTYTVTNIRVAKEDLKKLKRIALERDESVSALLRGLIATSLPMPKRRAKKKDEIWKLEKYAVNTGDKNLSKRVDEIAYGGK